MIKINNVSKSFGKQEVLNNINLHIKKGEIFGLLGPSGAGKTTLIRLIAGSEKLDSGEIYVDKNKVPSFSVLRDIGFMPQNDALYTDITGYDNIKFFGNLYGMKGRKLEQAIKEMLELVGLTEDANKLVINYSGGMKKRLSLIITLIHDPKILILDEPTVGIDPLLRRKIWQEFIKLSEKGKTLIITTHVMDEIKNCDRAALIREGHLIACDTVNELMKLGKGDIENLFFNLDLIKGIDTK